MYGTQAMAGIWDSQEGFENDVKMYGTQAKKHRIVQNPCLRMM